MVKHLRCLLVEKLMTVQLFGSSIAVLNKMRYTPLATDAHGGLCPMPYALCPMPYALCPREHLMLLRKAIVNHKFLVPPPLVFENE